MDQHSGGVAVATDAAEHEGEIGAPGRTEGATSRARTAIGSRPCVCGAARLRDAGWPQRATCSSRTRTLDLVGGA
jgi:hypothetical protein